MFKWIAIAVFAGFLMLTGFRLLPVYINNHALKEIVSDVIKDESLKSRPKREVLLALKGQFDANNLAHLEPKEIVKVARDNNGDLVLDVKYEERRKLLYNLEIVAGFDEQFTN